MSDNEIESLGDGSPPTARSLADVTKEAFLEGERQRVSWPGQWLVHEPVHPSRSGSLGYTAERDLLPSTVWLVPKSPVPDSEQPLSVRFSWWVSDKLADFSARIGAWGDDRALR